MADKSYLPNPAKNSQKSIYICLNPCCKEPTNRFVTDFDPHFTNNVCSKWFVQTNTINQNLLKVKKKQTTSLVQIPFGQQPMECILNHAGLKNLCIEKLRVYMDQLTQKISQILKTVYQVLNTKLDVYFKPFQLMYGQIVQIIKDKNVSVQRINNLASSPEMKKISLSQDIIILPQIKQVELKIKGSLSQLTERLICSKQSIYPDIGISLQQKKNLSKYLKDNSDDHNRKMAKLSNLLKADSKFLYERRSKNMSQSYYTNSNYQTQFLVRCPICAYNCSTQKKKQLMVVWNNLIEHLFAAHIQELGYSYEHLITGKTIYQTSIEQIIYKMTEYSYQGLELIYKNGKKNYSFHYSNKKKFSVEILSKNQSMQFPIKYMYLNDFNQFYCFLGTIAYALQNNIKSKNKTVVVYINTQTQISLIRKLNQMLNVKNIQIAHQKKPQQSNVLYQDEGEDVQKDQFNMSFNNATKEEMQEERKTCQ